MTVDLDRMSARVWSSVDQPADFFPIPVVFNRALWDSGRPTPFWSVATPTRLTAPVSGRYLVIGSAIFLSNAPADEYVVSAQIQRSDGVPVVSRLDADRDLPLDIIGRDLNLTSFVELAAGQWVELLLSADFLAAGEPVGGIVLSEPEQSPILQISLLERTTSVTTSSGPLGESRWTAACARSRRRAA